MQTEKRNETESAKNLLNLKNEANKIPQRPNIIPYSLEASERETDAPSISPLAAPIPGFPRDAQRRISKSARTRPSEIRLKTKIAESDEQKPKERARNTQRLLA